MVQPQMDWDWFGNVSNLDMVKQNRIRDLIYALDCYLLNFLML